MALHKTGLNCTYTQYQMDNCKLLDVYLLLNEDWCIKHIKQYTITYNEHKQIKPNGRF